MVVRFMYVSPNVSNRLIRNVKGTTIFFVKQIGVTNTFGVVNYNYTAMTETKLKASAK